MNSMGHNAKKIMAALAAAGLVLSLAGCTDKEKPSSETNLSTVSDMTSSTEDSEISSEIGSEISSGTESEPVPDSTSPAITDTKDELKPGNAIDPKDAAEQITGVDVPSTSSTPSESDNTSEPASSSSTAASTPTESKPEQSTASESKPTPSSSSTPTPNTPVVKPTGQVTASGEAIIKGKYTGYTPDDTTGIALDANGCPADAKAWYTKYSRKFVDSTGQLWEYSRAGWEKASPSGTIVDEYSDKPLSGHIVGH